MDHLFYTLVFVLALVVVYVRISIPYIRYFVRYMFNETVGWNKYVEKPRLVFYGMGLLLMHFSVHSVLQVLPRTVSLLVVLNWILFSIGFYLCMVTWTKKFMIDFIPRIAMKIQGRRNFRIMATNRQLERLYRELVRLDMIDSQKTGAEDFINAFLLDWDAHESRIYFTLDSPSLREFYELLKTAFPKNSLHLIDFISNSKVVLKSDGRRYNYDTIRSLANRIGNSKRSIDLKSVFSNFS